MKKRVIWRLLGGCLLALVLIGATAASSASAQSYLFDAQLSLTGGCTTNLEDEVPDPSCPYSAFPAGPSGSFSFPRGMAVDSYGDIYVAVHGPAEQEKGHIDIFNSAGEFITELPEPHGPISIAVDGKGNLYVQGDEPLAGPTVLRMYEPSTYNPATGEIAYGLPPTILRESSGPFWAMAINPDDDHLFVNFGDELSEYGSAEEGNPIIEADIGTINGNSGSGIAVDATRGRLYVKDGFVNEPGVIRVFELAPPHDLIETIDGSSIPPGDFVSDKLSIAVDEETGNLFVYEQELTNSIYELTFDGDYLATIQHGFKERKQQVVVDNGENSPHGELSTEGRYLFATSASSGVGHMFAFAPANTCAPEVGGVSFSEVSEDEALLQASIKPCQPASSYRFEYVTAQQFAESEFVGAQVAGQGSLPAGSSFVSVSAEATQLAPGTAYVFRVVASNEAGGDEARGEFKTYPAIIAAPCSNDVFRTGPSSYLPDCRAYELVTPPDTNGRAPMGLGLLGPRFPSVPASPDGSRVSFRIEGGLIPGSSGAGAAAGAGDPYLATRTPTGWNTAGTGGSATEAVAIFPGGHSPDQNYSAWVASGQGSAVISSKGTTIYVRYPDGHSEVFGRGSLGVDPNVEPKLISENGGHMIFVSTVRLEENAAQNGQVTIYDRTPDEVTHVLSLMPGNLIPSSQQAVAYRGSSLDGRGVAFSVSEPSKVALYLRTGGQTYEAAENAVFEGVAEGGKRVFYLKNGSLFAFDTEAGTIPFATPGNVTVINVSADGSTAYFVSQSKLTGSSNPIGEKAVAGKENLYRSEEGTISFVGIVSKEDVVGEIGKNVVANGLGLWVNAVTGLTPGAFAIDPSRTTADGQVLLFQSNADLTDYESAGYRQVYRYDAAANALACLSCNPTGAPASGGANLQEVQNDFQNVDEPNTAHDLVKNLSASGARAFFQSVEPLVAADTNGLQDVYEWEAQGVGSCTSPGGCVYLISSGRSEKDNFLYAASESGDDVFFRTADLLRPIDNEATPSIYDAKVGGGFPEPTSAECEGEGCRPQLTPSPALPMPGMSPGKSGNVAPKCPKGKRKVKRRGKVRCVKKKHRRHHRRQRSSGKNTKGARK